MKWKPSWRQEGPGVGARRKDDEVGEQNLSERRHVKKARPLWPLVAASELGTLGPNMSIVENFVGRRFMESYRPVRSPVSASNLDAHTAREVDRR
jgi:hypothetical protein